jgi:2-amino-4-hydroxy-6-hydroxymethyldihydropteridine diphosphokinase
MSSIAYIGLGSNLGDPRQHVLDAISLINALPGVWHCENASLYASAPIEASGPNFVNTVAKVETSLSPIDLLKAMQAIELKLGRERSYQNAPRTLDLDLLWYDAIEMKTPILTLPHPRMHLRAFVLKPLSELTKNFSLPEGDLTSLLEKCADQKIWVLEKG